MLTSDLITHCWDLLTSDAAAAVLEALSCYRPSQERDVRSFVFRPSGSRFSGGSLAAACVGTAFKWSRAISTFLTSENITLEDGEAESRKREGGV